MAGRPGRSGGHNRLTPAEHILRGTFNPTRHRTTPTAAPAPTRGPLPAAVLAGLEGRGRAFVSECWTTYQNWTPGTLVLLREAGLLIEQLEKLRGTPDERAAQRLLVGVLAALRLGPIGAAADRDRDVPPAVRPRWAGILP
jgi:hypothetical protein